jgi:hypothetical protein
MKRTPRYAPLSAGFVICWCTALAQTQSDIRFEPEPRIVAEGRSPKLVARRQHGLYLLYSARSAKGGADLWMRSSQDLGDTFSEPMRVNDVEGEVSDHGENSAQLLVSPDQNTLYVVWNGKDPSVAGGSHIRFARSGAMAPNWTKAVTLNDDRLPVSHAFQGAAVAPDGTIYVAWLDSREQRGGRNSEGTSALYLTRSFDGGQSWEPNTRVAGDICPCCRVAIGFSGGKVLVFWRGVEPDQTRDIYVAISADRGATWSSPRLVARDGWKINGCPHVGPAVASAHEKLWVVWFTEAGNDPAIYAAWTGDGGGSFSGRIRISESVTDPTHPAVAGDGERLSVTFQARDAALRSGWGAVHPYYREIRADGTLSSLLRLPVLKANATYPSVTLGLSGRVFLSWTETVEGQPRAVVLRARIGSPGTASRRTEPTR